MSNRLEKVNSVVKKDISNIISNELNDPRFTNSFVTVSSVNVSADLKYAKIFLSVFTQEGKQKDEVLSAIKSANGYIRKQLASRLKLRTVPTLDFVLDTSAEYSQKINSLINKLSDN